jgi:WD40 repeat protein
MDVIQSIRVSSIPPIASVWRQRACAVSALDGSKPGINVVFHLGSIYLWDVECETSQQPNISFVSSLAGAHLESVNCIRWNSKGTHLASASDDSNIFIWIKAPTIATDPNTTIVSKGNQLSTMTNDNDNMLGWDKDVPESKERWLKGLPYKSHLEPVLDLAWSRDDQILVSGSVDKKVVVVSDISSITHALTPSISVECR